MPVALALVAVGVVVVVQRASQQADPRAVPDAQAAVSSDAVAAQGDAPVDAPGGPASPSPPDTSPSGAPVAPSKPVEPGTQLEQLPAPPERSLWALSADSYSADIEIAVEFKPYGIGPSSFGPSIVALVISSKPTDPAAEFPDITDRNVVFLVGDTVVDKGGRYTGTAVTRTQDDRVVLVLKDVRPVP